MQITFGLDLDGTVPAPDSNGLGVRACGPLGLLDLLEKQLGLAAAAITPADRIVAARQVLAGIYNAGPAYGLASFAKDSLAVAETFLSWRDDLVLSGWNRKAFATTSPKLQLLLQLEAALPDSARNSEGDRIVEILAALPNSRQLVEVLSVVDARRFLPSLWQTLLDRLGAVYETPPAVFPGAPAGSDLQQLQQALRTGASTLSLKQDGTVQIVTAHSEWVLARAAAEAATLFPGAMLVADESAHMMEQALVSRNAPRLGLDPVSRSRAIPQVLALALRLRWDPLDPQQLLEFLIHPVCPVANPLRRLLVEALEAAPGIGGRPWREAMQKARSIAQSNGEKNAELLSRIDRDLKDWIVATRFDRTKAAPGSDLAATSDGVCAWAGARATQEGLSPSEQSLFLSLSSSASQLSRALRTLQSVTEPELSRLLDHVLGRGCSAGEFDSELGHLRIERRPGAVRQPAKLVLWWNAAEPSLHGGSPWTPLEIAELAGAGVTPLSEALVAEREARFWPQPVLAACDHLLFYVPQQRAGDPVTRHPLISRLAACTGTAGLPVWNLDETLSDPNQTSLNLRHLEPKEIPTVRRWWRLPAGVIPTKAAQVSFSSLEKFIYSPHQWVLRYAARLRPGRLGRRLICDSQLYGILIHRLVEDLFNQPPPAGLDWRRATNAAISEWVANRWPTLLQEEGGMLLLPGQRSTAARIQTEAIRALTDLIAQFRTWDVIEAQADVTPAPLAFIEGELTGHIDLVVRNSANRTAVVDLKYGGRDNKIAQVAKGIPLQLAVYSRLLAEGKGSVAGAFYILTARRLISRHPDFFKDSALAKGDGGSADLDEVWREFEQVWDWRRQQLDQGWIELSVGGAEPTPADGDQPGSAPPLVHWTPPEDADRYSDYTTLTGFPANA